MGALIIAVLALGQAELDLPFFKVVGRLGVYLSIEFLKRE